MKATFHEYDNDFSIYLVADSIEDAAWLARWSLNAKKDVAYRSVRVSRGGRFVGDITWDKRKDSISSIRRKG